MELSPAGKKLVTIAMIGQHYRDMMERAKKRLITWCPNCDLELEPNETWDGAGGAKAANLVCRSCGRSANICIYPRAPESFPVNRENAMAFPDMFTTVEIVLVRGERK